MAKKIDLSFSETQATIDAIFDSLDSLLSRRDVALRSHNYFLCSQLDKRWYTLHHLLDKYLAHQKSLY